MIAPDASVALKHFLHQACRDKAMASLEGYSNGQGAIAVLELLFDRAW